MSELSDQTAVFSDDLRVEVVADVPVKPIAMRPKDSVYRAVCSTMAPPSEKLAKIEERQREEYGEETRFSIPSALSDEGLVASPVKVFAQEEEIEKQGTDSGYESDRRKSFSSSVAESVPATGLSDVEVESPRSLEEKKEADREEHYREVRAQYLQPFPFIQPVLPMHPLPQQPAAFHRHAIIACNQHLRLPLPQPAVYLKQAEAVVQKQHEAWEFQTRFLGMRETRLANSPRASPSLPPVVLPLPVCCKASPVGPKETRKYAIPKYAIGFVIGPNGLRIQATRDVSGATIFLLEDKDSQYTVIGVFGSPGQIHDAIYLMKQNVLRYSGMFIGDIDGMFKQIHD